MVAPVVGGSRYSGVLGGLDNAVKQAAQRHLEDLFIVDVDCHQGEPFAVFSKYLPEKYRKDYSNANLLYASMTETASGGGGTRVVSQKVKQLRTYDRSVGGRIRRPEIKSIGTEGDTMRMGEQPPEEVVEVFTQRMRDIGIKRCVIFPNAMLGLGNHPNFDVEVALDNAYMDYMLDNFLGKYPEILSCVTAPANTPDKAAELIDRVGSEKGIVGVSVTPCRPGPFAGDHSWDPIYEAAERKGLPICIHGEASKLPPLERFGPERYLPVHALGFPLSLILEITSIVVEGLPERYPNLKFVFMEGGITWIPWLMKRLDTEYTMRRTEAPLLKKLPSHYIKQFYYSQQPLESTRDTRELEYFFKAFNADTQLLYASDYPHWDFDAPSVIYDLPFLSKTAKEAILGETARKLFKLS